MAPEITVKDLLEAGVHFGHQKRRWNPKMRPFIYASRDGIHIIDLDQTAKQARNAYKFVADSVALGGSVLFVGTKRQAQEAMQTEAERSSEYYVTKRWLGGMLTNFQTIRKSIDRLKYLYERKEKGDLDKLTKKEGLRIEREIEKLEYNLGGIKDMTKPPSVIFIVDPNHEDIAKKEAIKLGIPVVALTDTNSNPDGVDYLIAGNDDAIRSIHYFASLMAEACLEGEKRREASLRDEAAKKDEAKAKPKGPAVREQRMEGKGRAWVAQKEGAPAAEGEVEKFASAKAAVPAEEAPKVEEKAEAKKDA
jgi:small subunit ribosomal protein S2